MNADFPRLITLLRKEKGISQKQAAAEFGISQALLSHYEKGIRECGLDFLVKCAKFYGVSCDYLLGVSPERNGRQLTVEDIPEADSAKDVVFKGNIMPVLNKKLISNSLGVVYDLIFKSESKQLNTEISNYLMMAVYRSFRILYSTNSKNENTMFAIPQELVSGYCNAAMLMSEARAQQLAQGADKGGERIKNLDEVKITTEYLMQNYPEFRGKARLPGAGVNREFSYDTYCIIGLPKNKVYFMNRFFKPGVCPLAFCFLSVFVQGCRLKAQRQGDGDTGADPFPAVQLQRAAVHGDDFICDSQPDAGAAGLGAAFVKLVFDIGKLILRNTGTIVPDPNDDIITLS